MNKKKLYLSKTNKIFAGVCGGLGEYFNINPTWVRIAVVVIGFFVSIFAVLAYVLASFFIDSYEDMEQKKNTSDSINMTNSTVIKNDKWTKYLWVPILPFSLLYFQLFKSNNYMSIDDKAYGRNGTPYLDGVSAIILFVIIIIYVLFSLHIMSKSSIKNKKIHMLLVIAATILSCIFVLSFE